MNKEKKMSGEFDRFILSILFNIVSALTSDRNIDVKEEIVGMIQKGDVSTLNNLLAERSQSLIPQVWENCSTSSFAGMKSKNYMGISAEDVVDQFNRSSKIRYMYMPFHIAVKDKSEEAELWRNLVDWSIECINGIWDGTGGAVDVNYWIKAIELFPRRLLLDRICFVSLCYEEEIIQQMISQLDARTTSIGTIPFGLIRELSELEAYITKYNKKHSAPRGTSTGLIKEMEKQKFSLLRLKTFADCSALFRLYSIRTVDIQLYSRIYCLPEEEQQKAKEALSDIFAVCEQMGTKPRLPDGA